MRNGFSMDVLTSVDIQEIVKIGGRVIEIYEGVIYREVFKITPFRKVTKECLLWGRNIKTKETIWCKVGYIIYEQFLRRSNTQRFYWFLKM